MKKKHRKNRQHYQDHPGSNPGILNKRTKQYGPSGIDGNRNCPDIYGIKWFLPVV